MRDVQKPVVGNPVFQKNRFQKPMDSRAREAALLSSVLLSTRADNGAVLPTAWTGCLSDLSSCHTQDPVYLEALKSYAEVYAAYQDYLTPENPLAAHDYVVRDSATEEHTQLGRLIEAQHDRDVSDDDIDGCGYLGWLRH